MQNRDMKATSPTATSLSKQPQSQIQKQELTVPKASPKAVRRGTGSTSPKNQSQIYTYYLPADDADKSSPEPETHLPPSPKGRHQRIQRVKSASIL